MSLPVGARVWLPGDLAPHPFDRGFSTKAGAAGQRGYGLALSGLVCRRRGGMIEVHNEGGAVFVARLPRAAVPA